MSKQPELLSMAAVKEVDPTRTLEVIVKQGCQFVVSGEVFLAVIELINRMLSDHAVDASGQQFLTQLLFALESTSVPVKPKERQIVLPGLGIPTR